MPSPTAATSAAKRILACEQAGITVTLPRPMTSNSKAEGRFGKQDFRYVAQQDVRETVEHPFGTIKARMGATHFLMNAHEIVRGVGSEADQSVGWNVVCESAYTFKAEVKGRHSLRAQWLSERARLALAR